LKELEAQLLELTDPQEEEKELEQMKGFLDDSGYLIPT
jgi:hypothetical protein